LDLTKFAIALRDGKLLNATSLESMKAWFPAEKSAELGLALFRLPDPWGSGKWLGHFGSVLGFNGAYLWKEEGDCAIAVLANVGTVEAGQTPSSASAVVSKTRFLKLAAELSEYE
jgi:D-alanyl-D-alanine carboxypeptidase